MRLPFLDPSNRTADTLVIGSAVVMLATFCYAILVPERSARDVAAGRTRSRESIERDIAMAKSSLVSAEAQIRNRVWNAPVESVTARLLDRWTKETAARGVTLVAFRPQKTRIVAGLQELPGVVQVSGAWPRIAAMLDGIAKPGNRTVVRGIQVASSDAASDTVTATVQVVAYVSPPKKAPPTVKTALAASGGSTWQK